MRFAYVHRPAWYLSVEPQRDVIEVPISDELDVGGWELRKALQLMHRSNPTLLEWLASPIVYREDAAAAQRMRTLAPTFFSERRGRWHYLSMAAKNFRGYLQGETVRLKKYLYVLRPLLAAQWIDAGRGMPPMRFADLADAMVWTRRCATKSISCWPSRWPLRRRNTVSGFRASTPLSNRRWPRRRCRRNSDKAAETPRRWTRFSMQP